MARWTGMFAILLVLAAPIAAQSDEPELEIPRKLDEAFRRMMEDVQPLMDEAMELMQSLGGIDDPRNYMLPEILPNGDIIIRRRPDAPSYRPELPQPGEELDDGSIRL